MPLMTSKGTFLRRQHASTIMIAGTQQSHRISHDADVRSRRARRSSILSTTSAAQTIVRYTKPSPAPATSEHNNRRKVHATHTDGEQRTRNILGSNGFSSPEADLATFVTILSHRRCTRTMVNLYRNTLRANVQVSRRRYNNATTCVGLLTVSEQPRRHRSTIHLFIYLFIYLIL